MNILIICTYYPPDTTIAAKRPYELANRLAELGNTVTVLRSGKLNRIPDHYYEDENSCVEVISYLGKDSASEKYKRGEKITVSVSKATFIPTRVRVLISMIYQIIAEPLLAMKRIKHAKAMYEIQKKAINSISERKFDIVFATYSELENIYAAEYATKLFGAKWIMDFRDTIDQAGGLFSPLVWGIIGRKIQYETLIKCDLCTVVSNAMRDKFRLICPDARVETLYNGYKCTYGKNNFYDKNDVLSFCYTGQLYISRMPALESMVSVIKGLIDCKRMDARKVRFNYAGPDSKKICMIFKRYGLSDIVKDYGYVGITEVKKIQAESDVFVVLSWNTKKEKGILTGKFYEGIESNKPILSLVSGSEPYSELDEMNKKYNYGFCYETCRKSELKVGLEQFIMKFYIEKNRFGKINFNQSTMIKEKFNYETIACSLEKMMLELVKM